MLRIIVLLLILAACPLGGCADEQVYDWQRPHDTYQVGSFSKYQNAEDLKRKLEKEGFDCRIETDIKNGQFFLNVLVDVYDKSPGSLAKLERISGIKPYLRGPRTGKTESAPTAPAEPAAPIPGKDL